MAGDNPTRPPTLAELLPWISDSRESIAPEAGAYIPEHLAVIDEQIGVLRALNGDRASAYGAGGKACLLGSVTPQQRGSDMATNYAKRLGSLEQASRPSPSNEPSPDAARLISEALSVDEATHGRFVPPPGHAEAIADLERRINEKYGPITDWRNLPKGRTAEFVAGLLDISKGGYWIRPNGEIVHE